MILADLAAVEAELRTLPVDELAVLSVKAEDQGLTGTRVTVKVPPEGHHHRGLKTISAMIEESNLPPPVKDRATRVFRRLAEAEELYEEAADLHGDAPWRGQTVADAASSTLFELRNLAIGMVAPEIEGQDTDGVAFKLSDYRGKVIMLDFWGHW